MAIQNVALRGSLPSRSINSFVVRRVHLTGAASLRRIFFLFFSSFAFSRTSQGSPKPTIYFPSNVPYNGRLGAPRLKQLDRQISGFRTGNCREKELSRKRHFAKDEICNKVSSSDARSLFTLLSALLAFPSSRSIRLGILPALLKSLTYFRKKLVKYSRTIPAWLSSVMWYYKNEKWRSTNYYLSTIQKLYDIA